MSNSLSIDVPTLRAWLLPHMSTPDRSDLPDALPVAIDRLAALTDEILGTVEAETDRMTAAQVAALTDHLHQVWEGWRRQLPGS